MRGYQSFGPLLASAYQCFLRDRKPSISLFHGGSCLYTLRSGTTQIFSDMAGLESFESIATFIELRRQQDDWQAAVGSVLVSPQPTTYDLLEQFETAINEPTYILAADGNGQGRETSTTIVRRGHSLFPPLHLLALVLGRQIEYCAWEELQGCVGSIRRSLDAPPAGRLSVGEELVALVKRLHLTRKSVSECRSALQSSRQGDEEARDLQKSVMRDTELCRRLYFILCYALKPTREQPSQSSASQEPKAAGRNFTSFSNWEYTPGGFERFMKEDVRKLRSGDGSVRAERQA